MPEFCSGGGFTEAKEDAYSAWVDRQDLITIIIHGVQIISWVAGLVTVFVWKWREVKPCFVWILWTLISLINLNMIAQFAIGVELGRVSDEKFETLMSFYEDLVPVNQCLVTITHWVLAIKYFEVVSEFPLIFAPQDDNIRAKQRSLRCLVWSANAGYFTITGLWLLAYFLVYAYPLDETWDSARSYHLLLFVFDYVIMGIPAILLVFAVQKLRRQIKNLRGFSVREQLMCVHIVVFLFNIFVNFAIAVSYWIMFENRDWSRYCRASTSFLVLFQIASTTNLATLWLVIFMSLQLSKPLTREWRESVSSYQGEDPELIQQSQAHASARRIHSATLEDANRQIRFLQALIVREREGEDTETQESPRESLIILSTEERNILEDSGETDTSSMLFARVRITEAEKIDMTGSVNTVSDLDLTGE